MTSDMIKKVESLIRKAERTENANHALEFSQAACNAANASLTIQHLEVLKHKKVLKDRRIWEVLERMQGEIAREIRVLLGEEQLDQSLFTTEQSDRRILAMQMCAAKSTDDATQHESWTQMHPDLLPWDQLPASTRSKAKIFGIVARTAAMLDGGGN